MICRPGTQPADFTAALDWHAGEFVEWLRGRWLEQLTYAEVGRLPEAFGLRLVGASVRCGLEQTAGDPTTVDTETEFEFDVLAVRGQRLWGFSCTTSSVRALCKTKLFEACHRLAQMGGSETQAVLVCAHARPEEIVKQARTRFVSHVHPFVCGSTDLPNLAEWVQARLTGSGSAA
ncbi:MAG: hypothetical protein IT204_06805 [Fimbriimonadaceae bacterium]|nr:hypothetical protein [Fimbriimonadaceae bacterium]